MAFICMRQSTDQQLINHFYVLATKATEFHEITQNNGHYAVQGHSRSPILVPIESPYATAIIEINYSNLPPILHRFQVMADNYSNFPYTNRGVPHFMAPAGVIVLCSKT